MTSQPAHQGDVPDRPSEATFHIIVGDEADLTVSEIWPDGDAPENPTVDDVIAVLKKQGKSTVSRDWGFDFYVEVNGRNVDW